MNKINDGGPAFPAKISIDRKSGELQPHQFGNDDFCATGMTLRDFFAAKAMQAAFTSPIEASKEGQSYIAMHAYRMADAMLAARGAQ
ncbi:MAG: hypothetical protein ACWGIK_00710 [Achromobacter pulmonis]